MNLKFFFLGLVLLLQLNFFAQNVVGVHEVQKGIQEHEYIIKTTVTGLKNVDIAKLVVEVDSVHQFKKTANNPYFFDRKGQEVKFYVMGIPPAGEINIEFSIVLSASGDFNFPVKFQYSKNEEKQQLDLPAIKISNLPLFAIETTSKKEQESKIAEEKELQQKLEEEKLAKNIARFNTEQEVKKKQEELAAKIKQEKFLAAQQETKRIEEEKVLQQKIEEEKLAKNIARFNAEQEEKKKQEELAAKIEQEKVLVAQQETKRIEEEKAKEKVAAENIAKTELEKQAKIDEKKLLAEKRQKEELETKRIAEEKAKEEKEEQQKIAIKLETKTSNLKTYSVQLLSLANYSEERLTNYCKKHNLAKDQIIKRQVGSLMKISYGKVNSQEEATTLQQKLKNQHQIDASFIVVLK